MVDAIQTNTQGISKLCSIISLIKSLLHFIIQPLRISSLSGKRTCRLIL
jgi:hypothetical protein